MINTWKETICKDSRFKEDFGNIRDMHRLLSFKGYRFQNSRQQNVAAQDTSVNLKSPEELEAEDREAQSAKLQELIRRGTPRDLQAAQELMKTLSGANPEAKPDYRSKTLHELEKLQSHVILLNDMLDNMDPSKPERLVQGDAYDQVATICRNARPKIQKWIADAESDDPESLDTFLSINDLINNVLDRYERYQKGDFTAAPQPEPSGPTNLIDFDADQGLTGTSGQSSNPVDDLESLFGGGPSSSTSPLSSSQQQPLGAISLGMGTPTLQSHTNPSTSFFSQQPIVPTPPTSPKPLGQTSTGGSLWNNPAFGGVARSTPPPLSASPAFGGSASTMGVGMGFNRNPQPTLGNGSGVGMMGMQTPMSFTQPTPTTSSPAPPATQPSQAKKDPFADLEGLF